MRSGHLGWDATLSHWSPGYWREVHCHCLTTLVWPKRQRFYPSVVSLVEVTNSTSTHLDYRYLHCYQQILFGMDGAPEVYRNIVPRLSGMGVMRNGSRSCNTLRIWHKWQCWMCASTISSSPGNHSLVRRYSLILVITWWPSCTSLTIWRVLETTILGPQMTSQFDVKQPTQWKWSRTAAQAFSSLASWRVL